MSSVVQNLKLEQIRTDGGTQPRTALNESTVADYAEAITDGAKLPPVVVFHDGADYWLADGFHRFFAVKKIGGYDIDADVRSGTKRDAVLYSVGANASHGLRRTNEDKRKAVMTLLEDAEWAKWSDREIARQCHVSPHTVADARRAICANAQMPAERKVERNGKTYEQNTANIGKKKDAAPVAAAPAKKPARTLEAESLPEEQMDANDVLAEAHHTITELAAEVDELNDRLAARNMDASEEEKYQAFTTITALRGQIKTLEEENAALKASRDTYMQKCAEMQKQINIWRKKAEKVAA